MALRQIVNWFLQGRNARLFVTPVTLVSFLMLIWGSLAMERTSQAREGMNHAKWDALLKQYVNGQSRVDYRRWKNDGLDSLNSYLQQLAEPWPNGLSAQERKAALINAYNALTIRWILQNYPVRSIWSTKDPFTAKRHLVDGHQLSLDEIESQLRNMGDPRIHAALVCAARSCPPLRREAYTGDQVEKQLDDNARAWLANRDLNEFLPDRHVARISKIFSWYKKDFEQSGRGVEKFLASYAPANDAGYLDEGHVKIEYKPYHWGLNDTSRLGEEYSQMNVVWDRIRKSF